MTHTVNLAAAWLLLGFIPVFAAEQSGTPATPAAGPAAPQAPEEAGASAAKEPALTEEEKAEKEARKECKRRICDILATRDPNGEDVACDIVKTWRAEDIAKMLGGKVDWPFGNAVCKSKLELKRASLAKAMSEATYEVVVPAQTVSCTLAQKDQGEPYVVEMEIAPKVSFENGKAVTAALNWGKASAPLFVYPLVYAGTGLDNQTNLLGPQVVRMVNEFSTKKCAEVKAELPTSPPAN
jgi:hypothetical protein